MVLAVWGEGGSWVKDLRCGSRTALASVLLNLAGYRIESGMEVCGIGGVVM